MINRQTIILLLLFFCINNCSGQTQIFYHEYEPTASDFAIIKWNIPENNLPEHYLKEIVDNQGRVTEIKFFENNTILFDKLCYLASWIKYEYPSDTVIIQYYLNGYGQPESGLECEMPYKVIYNLNYTQKYILNTQTEYYVDTALYLTNGWTLNSINETLNELKKNHQTCPVVDYYSKSIAKLSGNFPTLKNFDTNEIYFNTTEKEEIIKALLKK